MRIVEMTISINHANDTHSPCIMKEHQLFQSTLLASTSHGRVAATSEQQAHHHDNGHDDDMFQGCAISPDGLCVLTSQKGQLRLYNTPSSSKFGATDTTTRDDTAAAGDSHDRHEPVDESAVSDTAAAAPTPAQHEPVASSSSSSSITSSQSPWQTALVAQGSGDCVRSYCWYPFMNSAQPASCCFLAACRDQPAHLYDAYTGAIRATYRPTNAADELASPTVLQFTADGQRLVTAGFGGTDQRNIHVFDLARPGHDALTVLHLGKTRRSSDGQKGRVSALAVKGTTTTTMSRNGIVAVGTYAPGSIYTYDERTSQLPTGTVWNGLAVVGHGKNHQLKRKRRFAAAMNENENEHDTTTTTSTKSIFNQARAKWFHNRAHSGITQLQWSSNDDYYLYSASRQSDAVLSWDLRMLSGLPDYQSQPIRGFRSFAARLNTNQRIQFDLALSGKDQHEQLWVGGTDGNVLCYDTPTGDLVGTIAQQPQYQSGLAVNGVSVHPSLSHGGQLLATASGERQFPSEQDLDQDAVLCSTRRAGELCMYRIDPSNHES